MKLENLIETTGRMIVITLIAFAINKTQWYQNLPIQTFTNTEPLICFLFVLSFFWVAFPIFRDKSQHSEDSKWKQIIIFY